MSCFALAISSVVGGRLTVRRKRSSTIGSAFGIVPSVLWFPPLIETLIANGSAYATSQGNVYYRVRQKSDYGKLSNCHLQDLMKGARDVFEKNGNV